jgi:hypothetical protein
VLHVASSQLAAADSSWSDTLRISTSSLLARRVRVALAFALSRLGVVIPRRVLRSSARRFRSWVVFRRTWRSFGNLGPVRFHCTELRRGFSLRTLSTSAEAIHVACSRYGANGVLTAFSKRHGDPGSNWVVSVREQFAGSNWRDRLCSRTGEIHSNALLRFPSWQLLTAFRWRTSPPRRFSSSHRKRQAASRHRN